MSSLALLSAALLSGVSDPATPCNKLLNTHYHTHTHTSITQSFTHSLCACRPVCAFLIPPPSHPNSRICLRVGVYQTFAKVFTKVAGCGRKAESRAKVAVGARGGWAPQRSACVCARRARASPDRRPLTVTSCVGACVALLRLGGSSWSPCACHRMNDLSISLRRSPACGERSCAPGLT